MANTDTSADAWRDARLMELAASPKFDTEIKVAMGEWQGTPMRFRSVYARLMAASRAIEPHPMNSEMDWDTLKHLAILHQHMAPLPRDMVVWHAAPGSGWAYGTARVDALMAVSTKKKAAKQYAIRTGFTEYRVHKLVIADDDVYGIPIKADDLYGKEYEILLGAGMTYRLQRDGAVRVMGRDGRH